VTPGTDFRTTPVAPESLRRIRCLRLSSPRVDSDCSGGDTSIRQALSLQCLHTGQLDALSIAPGNVVEVIGESRIRKSGAVKRVGNMSYIANRKFAAGLAISALLLVRVVWGQNSSEPPVPAQTGPAKLLSGQQLDNLVAPIALYPDPLLGEVLAASPIRLRSPRHSNGFRTIQNGSPRN
jgi:hypothetical protein